METKIKEVQDYFKSKLIDGDFDVKEVTEYTISVKIYGQKFHVWIGNFHNHESINLYDGYYNFIMFDLTDEEKLKLQTILKKVVVKFKKELLAAEKERRIKELEEELQELDG